MTSSCSSSSSGEQRSRSDPLSKRSVPDILHSEQWEPPKRKQKLKSSVADGTSLEVIATPGRSMRSTESKAKAEAALSQGIVMNMRNLSTIVMQRSAVPDGDAISKGETSDSAARFRRVPGASTSLPLASTRCRRPSAEKRRSEMPPKT